MVISHSHSQPLLDHRTEDHNHGDLLSGTQGSSSDGSSSLPSGGTLRTHSCEDMLSRIRRGGIDETKDYFKRRETDPAYVSFEDMLASKEYREANSRPPEAAIRDPLVRTASRLYTSTAHPRQRRRSPGPLGTRRGGTMYRFVKKYVCPCLELVGRAFGCMPGVAAN
ncbi:hypothetical protein ZWY2020_056703 [Hordeum vulgare]|nr:hypothetical protein ZWY2020_056703 [Hordeum vulgare]